MVELIHADAYLRELGVIADYTQYDALAALSSTGGESDWMLEMPEEIFAADPVALGDYVYINGTEFGGPCERIRRSSADGCVRMYGALWRGLLSRRVISPPSGKTHLELAGLSGSQTLTALLGSWNDGLMRVAQTQDGLTVSAKIRYLTLAEAAESALGEAGGRLGLRFENGVLTLTAEHIRDLSRDVELSDEYSCTLVSDSRSAVYDHILALGRGEMLERQTVELWLLPDGTVSTDSSLYQGEHESTLLYDYTFPESLEELEKAARAKLLEYTGGGKLEFEFTDGTADFSLCDRLSVRDTVTGISRVMSVVQKGITITQTGVSQRHILA